jgi:hypothetical protein
MKKKENNFQTKKIKVRPRGRVTSAIGSRYQRTVKRQQAEKIESYSELQSV